MKRQILWIIILGFIFITLLLIPSSHATIPKLICTITKITDGDKVMNEQDKNLYDIKRQLNSCDWISSYW